MSLPVVAIIGRPNVGKSSLMNRLARRRISIVDPTPGVTRDRVASVIEVDPPLETPRGTPPKLVELVDTGGYGVYVADGGRYDDAGADLSLLTPDIEAQIAAARARAAIVLFVIDAQAGVTALDETVARILREEGVQDAVVPVANKVDGESWVPHAMEAAALGFGEPLCVSAESGRGIRELLDRIWAGAEESEEVEVDPEMKLAIVGCRNVGKSTLINTLAGEPRVIVSEIAGTTRDAIDARFEIDGRSMIAIDTAGLRKKKSFADDVEYYAYHRLLSSIRRADVAILMLDASREVSAVDRKLAQELQRQYKPTVIAVNKTDLVEGSTAPEDWLEYLTEQLRGLDYAPIVFLSARDGEGTRELVSMAFNLFEQSMHREETGKLNRVIEHILEQRGPSSRLGKQAKLYYATQIGVRPPTIAVKVNRPELFRGRYERYLLNRLREELPFSEVPIRLLFTARDRLELDEMKQAGRARHAAE